MDYFSYDEGAVNTPQADAFLERTLAQIQAGGYDGLLALARTTPAFLSLCEKGVYVATAVNDIDHEMRRFHICYDGFIAGRIAAELIYRWMPDHSRPVAIASGWENLRIHSSTVHGFEEQAKQTPLNIAKVYYNYDNSEVAYTSTIALLKEIPDLGAIYVNSFNSGGVIRAVREMQKNPVLITSDLNAELRNAIRSGTVAASIFQNQYEQGRRGLHCMFRALTNGETITDTMMISPEIVLSSNMSRF